MATSSPVIRANGRRRRLGLRARATVAFGCLALVLSSALAVFAHEVTRRYLLDQRERAAQRQTFANARGFRDAAAGEVEEPGQLLSQLQTSPEGGAVVQIGGRWLGTSVAIGQAHIPDALERHVFGERGVAHQRTQVGGEPFIAVGVPLPEIAAEYFEFIPLIELADTLGTLGRVLTAAAAVATLAGAAVGAYLSARVLRPLDDMATSASMITSGTLEQLGPAPDRDLVPIVTSFNAMVDELRHRIDRERRFASDVSHELRTPLAAMTASLNVARRQTTDEKALLALDELNSQVDRFTILVLELLEIARAQAGAIDLQLEATDLGALAHAHIRSRGGPPIAVHAPAPAPVVVDKRRVGQVLANLLDNADRYAGGAVAVAVEVGDQTVRLVVDDDGPGVPEEERAYVFERFARGAQASSPSAPAGTGLGLALVAEHVRLHDGRVWIDSSPSGGARFLVELPKAGG
jgi:two-component system sensor histidine kinase MtrB